jgi:excisionase family DNA binding protein
MRTDKPLLISIREASFQLSLPEQMIVRLIGDGELSAVKIREQVLVVYDSLASLTRRARRNNIVVQVEGYCDQRVPHR